jgi:hypothetical protein
MEAGEVGLHEKFRQIHHRMIATKTGPEDGIHVPKHVLDSKPHLLETA